MIAALALYLALHAQPSVDTVRADRFIASTPCTTSQPQGGDVALGFGPPFTGPLDVLRCRVPPVANPDGMRGTWYRLTADGWTRNTGPGTWTPIVGQP